MLTTLIHTDLNVTSVQIKLNTYISQLIWKINSTARPTFPHHKNVVEQKLQEFFIYSFL